MDPQPAAGEAQASGTSTSHNIDTGDHASVSKTLTSQTQKAGSSSSDSGAAPEANHDKTKKEKKSIVPSPVTALWKKIDLDILTVMMMLKASIPPTVGIAMYRSNVVAGHYTTIGYLIPISSILGMCILPRAKFMQNMITHLVAICLGACMALLAFYCSTQARKHTTPPGRPLAGYNSSASVVSAIWLIFQVFLVNAIKSARPQFAISSIVYSIFCIVAITYAPIFGTMAQGISFTKRLLETFLTGFGLATVVALFVIPVSCRKVIFAQMNGYMGLISGVLQAQTAYMSSMEENDMFILNQRQPELAEDSQVRPRKFWKHQKPTPPPPSPVGAAVARLKGAIAGLTALHGKIAADMPLAKREFAVGKLCAGDMKQLFKLLERITLPLISLSSVIDIFERIAVMYGWSNADTHQPVDGFDVEEEREAVKEWQIVMKVLHEPFAMLTTAMCEAMEHCQLLLELKKPEKKKKNVAEPDVEGDAQNPRPGSKDFAAYLDRKIDQFYQGREITLKQWCAERGFDHATFGVQPRPEQIIGSFVKGLPREERLRRQLFLAIYMEHILFSTARQISKLVQFADTKVEDGTMARSRLILPGWKRLSKWFYTLVSSPEHNKDDKIMEDVHGDYTNVQMGSAFGKRCDPEHLPPTNTWERVGDVVRKSCHLLRSPHAAFGLRVACATMSVGVVAFLKDTQNFFIKQRLLWAMIMIAFSMSRTSGQSLFSFISRILGTVVAMVASYVIWYIVDGHTAGIIVFLWLWLAIAFYVPLKQPRYAVVGILMAVTTILIVGYELQVRKIGIQAAESNGQEAYPIYELAPYRLATVVGGLSVAYIWTIFPYPVNETSELRQDLGAALYLLANYYSITHETVRVRVKEEEGNIHDPSSPGAKLQKARLSVFSKLIMLVTQLRTNSTFITWQPQMGGKFPHHIYLSIIETVARLANYTALLNYASEAFSNDFEQQNPGSQSQWKRDFRALIKSTNPTSHDITSIISMLGNAVYDGRPLPPYLRQPDPFRMLNTLAKIDIDILSVKHIAEPGYSAFAVMQIAARCITADIRLLENEVKKLVGELDFSFHIISTSDGRLDSESDLSESGSSGKASSAGDVEKQGKAD